MNQENYILMNIAGVAVQPPTVAPFFVLKGINGEGSFPIRIRDKIAAAYAANETLFSQENPYVDMLKNIVHGIGLSIRNITIKQANETSLTAHISFFDGEKERKVTVQPEEAVLLASLYNMPVSLETSLLNQPQFYRSTSSLASVMAPLSKIFETASRNRPSVNSKKRQV